MTHPRRTYRCPEDLYQRAKARAKAEGTTVSEIINERLERYADGAPVIVIYEDGPDEVDLSAPKFERGERNIIVERAEQADVIIHDDAPAAVIATGRTATTIDVVAADPSDPTLPASRVACTALIGPEAKPCPCSGFQEQKVSPNRCGQCGHLKGLHQ